MNYPETWTAGFVNRWHTNDSHELRNSQDTNHAHQCRVALLMYALFPDCTRDDLLACLVHDLPEKVTGDVSGEVKRGNPSLAAMLDDMSLEWLDRQGLLFNHHAARLKLCDLLDAYLFARSINPTIVVADEWRLQRADILLRSRDLGVVDIVKEWM